MDFKFLRYNTTGAVPYTQGGFVTRQENCNGFIAINTGDAIVFVNDRILYPGVPGTSNGDSVTVGGNFGEIYTGNIKISFGAGANPQVTVEQKFYYLTDNQVPRK